MANFSWAQLRKAVDSSRCGKNTLERVDILEEVFDKNMSEVKFDFSQFYFNSQGKISSREDDKLTSFDVFKGYTEF